jgi:hypothetical protein
MRLSATRDGKLTSLQQDWVNHTSILDDYKENCGEATAHMYSVPNLRITSALARRNVGTPTPMRGPGAVPGLWATESAMDELALKLMGWTPPSCNGIKVPKWKWVQSTKKERSVRNEDYDNWDRFGKEPVSSAWRR